MKLYIFNIRKTTVTIFMLAVILPSCTPPPNLYRNSLYYGYNRKRIVSTARQYIGVRYRSGGTTPAGFDCSGFVMYVYRKNGIQLPRSAKDQYYSGRRLSLRRAKPGDLVFFRTSSRKRFSHVGIYLGNHRFIHSPRTGKRIGYADMNKKYWRKRYVGAVSYISGR